MTRAILTCSPYFPDLALNELQRHHHQITILRKMAPGYLLLEAPFSFGKLTEPWRSRIPIYLHHLFPMHETIHLGDGHDLLKLKRAASNLASPDATLQLRIADPDSFPISLPEARRDVCGQEMPYSAETPDGRIVSILITGNGPFRAYLGISWAAQNLSPWPGGRQAVTECVPNRAGYKLLEALDTFGLNPRPGQHALDLGAAPGAWSTLLLRRGMRITAVAPTPLYPWLMHHPHIIYAPKRAEDFLGECSTTFDLIVNDMRLDAQDSARLMVEYARHLHRGGAAVMTLKLRRRNRRRVMDHALRLLRRAYKIIHVRQLVSNQNEVTLLLRRKSLVGREADA